MAEGGFAAATLALVSRGRIATVLGAIVAFYFATRLGLLWRKPPYIDEYIYAYWTQLGHDNPAERFTALNDNKGPLFTWLSLIPMHFDLVPVTSVRAVAFASGLLTMTMIGLIGRHLWDLRVGLAAAAIYAVVPLFVVHDALGIIDSLLPAIATTALYLQIRLVEQPRLDLSLLLGFALAAALLTKETGKTALLLLPFSLLLFAWHLPRLGVRLARWAAYAGLSALMALIGFSIMFLSPAYYSGYGDPDKHSHQYRTYEQAFGHVGRWVKQNGPVLWETSTGYLGLPLLFVIAAGIWFGLRSRPRATLLLLGWAGAPLVGALLVAIAGYARYLLLVMPPLVILGGVGLVHGYDLLAARVPRARLRLAAAIALAVGALPPLWDDVRVEANPTTYHYPGLDDNQFVSQWGAGPPWDAVVDELYARAKNRPEPIAFTTNSQYALQILLPKDRFTVVSTADPVGQTASFVIENGFGLGDERGAGKLKLVKTFPRPHGGVPVKLYARVAG